jgi:Peptidase family C25
VYTLLDPAGVIRATLNGGLAAPPAGDNAWTLLFDSSAPPAPAFETQTTVQQAASTTIALAVPAGTVAGDVLVASIARNSGVNAVAPPATGWTTVDEGPCNNSAIAGTCRLGVFYHVYLAAGEPASYTFSWTGNQVAVGGLLRYSGVNTATPVNVSASAFGTNNTPAAPTVTTTGANRTVVRLAAVDTNVLTGAPATSRYALLQGGATGVGGGASDLAQAAAGASGAANFTASAAQPWRTVTLALNPAAAAAPTAGHWELRVDQSTTADAAGNRDAINAFGLRAHDGDSTGGGTELNVYFDAMTDMGVNPPTAGTNSRAYLTYPYVTSGCAIGENDFDFDSASTTAQSIAFKTRTGTAIATIADANLSINDQWNRNQITGWTSDSASTQYGIWTQTSSLNSYLVGGAQNGNYADVYVSNFNLATTGTGVAAPTANPPANSFRSYLPTDAGGAPVEPYLEQALGYLSGPKTLAIGQTTIFTVTVRLVNPTPNSITFGTPGTDIVTVNIPSVTGSLGFQGGAGTTQGTVTATPAVNGFGDVTWNPGTVTSGTTALLFFNVGVRPTALPQRITVTSTPASGNGTRATFVDQTGNTTQARATFTLGPICELAANSALVTPAVVSSVRAHGGPRGVEVEWETASEVGTVGFDLLRWDPETKAYVTLNKGLLPGLQGSPQGGHYRFVDEGASAIGKHWYVVSEATASGERRFHGPFEVEVEGASSGPAPSPDGYDKAGRRPPARAAAAFARGRALGALPRPFVGATALKIGVDRDGLYFVPATSIASALGIPVGQVRADLGAQNIRLSAQGKAIAWMPASGGLLFYGRALHSIYASDNVYWLGVGRGASMGLADGGRPSPVGQASFLDEVHAEENHLPATAVSTDPESDYWYWDYLSGGDPTYGSKTFPITAVGVDRGGVPGRLRIHLQGATATGVTGEHHVLARLNGTPVGEVRWEGITPAVIDVPVGATLIQEGLNTVSLDALLDSSAPYSILYVDSFDLDYPRFYDAVGASLAFRGDAHGVVTVGGFAEPGISVFDVTHPDTPRRVYRSTLTGGPGAYQVTVVPSGPDTRYVAATPEGWLAPKWIRPASPGKLATQTRGAAYVVLTSTDLLAPARRIAALRQRRGLSTLVVDVADVMDEFNYGISNPHAIQAFLQWAAGRWSPAPRFLLLAGLGTLDYKDYLGHGGNLVPPLMVSTPSGLFASDNALADLDGDGVPDIAVGRVPAVIASELDAYAAKVEAYESSDGGDWKGRAVWAADKPDGAADFAADAESLVSRLPSGYSTDRVYLLPGTIDATRAQLLTDLQGGAGLMNYVGHGGIDRLSAEGMLVAGDAPTLTNAERLPMLTALTCTINRFEVPGFVSLGGELVKSAGGGFSAVWAPTGLSVSHEANALGELFYANVAGTPGATVGELARATLEAYAGSGNEPSLTSVYTLLGDPALKLKTPEVQPPAPPVIPEVSVRVAAGRRRPE